MTMQSSVGEAPESAAQTVSIPSSPHRRMSPGNRLLFFLTAWLIVLMPFLFWWNTWFGRHLSDKQIEEYLHDEKHPRHIQHALVQIGERMGHGGGAARWYPELIPLATYPVEEVRNTDAWVMGQDTTYAGFHPALLSMLQDSSAMVRGNAALSLVRFGDASGRTQILALLMPAKVTAPAAGRIVEAGKVGTPIRQGGLLAKLEAGGQTIELRSPIAGRIRTIAAANGANVSAGDKVATVDPATEQVWEALRALYLIGQVDDLAVIRPYERELPEVSESVRQQALLTEKGIRERAAAQP